MNNKKISVTKESGLTQVTGINLSWDKLFFTFNPYRHFQKQELKLPYQPKKK